MRRAGLPGQPPPSILDRLQDESCEAVADGFQTLRNVIEIEVQKCRMPACKDIAGIATTSRPSCPLSRRDRFANFENTACWTGEQSPFGIDERKATGSNDLPETPTTIPRQAK